MVTIHIDSGICGFTAEVRAFRLLRKSVGFAIKSECKQVMALARHLDKLDLNDILHGPIHKNPVYELAGKSGLHSSCPVPCGIVKAAEVELGLALKMDVNISFTSDEQGESNAD